MASEGDHAGELGRDAHGEADCDEEAELLLLLGIRDGHGWRAGARGRG
jgi:hypothetical protein